MKRKCLFLFLGLSLFLGCSPSEVQELIEPNLFTDGVAQSGFFNNDEEDTAILRGRVASNDFVLFEIGFEVSQEESMTNPIRVIANSAGFPASPNVVQVTAAFEFELGTQYFYRVYAKTNNDEFFFGNVLNFTFD